MISREMHYDFKQKLNKIDSQKYRNLLVPEIDWKLNEAQEVFVKSIAEPRFAKAIGFETSQRTISDIRTLVVDQNQKDNTCIKPTLYDTDKYLAQLPDEFWFHVKSSGIASKGNCTGKKMTTRVVQHDDENELSPFDRSSFDWREVNIQFNKDGIVIFTDGQFVMDWLCLSYIKVPRRIHNAQDYQGGSYKTLDGILLTGSQDCELPTQTHREIVDLAVLITTGDLQLPDYQIKANKLSLTN